MQPKSARSFCFWSSKDIVPNCYYAQVGSGQLYKQLTLSLRKHEIETKQDDASQHCCTCAHWVLRWAHKQQTQRRKRTTTVFEHIVGARHSSNTLQVRSAHSSSQFIEDTSTSVPGAVLEPWVVTMNKATVLILRENKTLWSQTLGNAHRKGAIEMMSKALCVGGVENRI